MTRTASVASKPMTATGATSARSFAATVAMALVAHDVPDATASEVAGAGRYVEDSLAAMPDVTRAGVRFASGIVYVALSLLGRAPYGSQDAATRTASAVRLAGTSLPVVSEFNKLTRGLGLVGVYELRTREGRLP